MRTGNSGSPTTHTRHVERIWWNIVENYPINIHNYFVSYFYAKKKRFGYLNLFRWVGSNLTTCYACFTLVTQTQTQTQTQRNVTTSNARIKIKTQDAEIIKKNWYSCVWVCVKACVSENNGTAHAYNSCVCVCVTSVKQALITQHTNKFFFALWIPIGTTIHQAGTIQDILLMRNSVNRSYIAQLFFFFLIFRKQILH